jgi:hypothetical protein
MKAISRSIRSWLLAALCVLPSSAAWARPYQITVDGGLVVSKLRDVQDPLGTLEALKSFTAGLRVGWPVGEGLVVQPGLLYVAKGVSYGKSQGTDPAGNPTGEFESLHVVDALEVPVFLRWRLPLDWRVRPVLLGGPFVSFETAERLKTTGSQNTSQSVDVLNNTDYGLGFGAGLEMRAGPGSWILEGRYDLGLANLGDFQGSDHVHSGAFAITTGYSF